MRLALQAVVFVLLAMLLAAGPASAQGRSGRSFLELDAVVVEGKIQRPQAVYIIQMAGLDFTSQPRKMNFLKEIVNSVEKEPF